MKTHLFSARTRAFALSNTKAVVLLSVGVVVLWTAVAAAQPDLFSPRDYTPSAAQQERIYRGHHESLTSQKNKLRATLELADSRCEQNARALEDAQRRQAVLANTQDKMRSEVNAHDISVEGALPILQLLEKEKIGADIQCCATESRIMALRKAIDTISAESQTLIEQDKVLEMLKRIVAQHQQKVDQFRNALKVGRNLSTELATAEAELAEVELRVLLREEELRKGGSADVLATFNRQLIELTVDHAEYEARRRFITERVREIRPVMKLIEEYRHLELRASAESVDQLRAKVIARQHELENADRRLQSVLEELKKLQDASQAEEETLEKDPEKS